MSKTFMYCIAIIALYVFVVKGGKKAADPAENNDKVVTNTTTGSTISKV